MFSVEVRDDDDVQKMIYKLPSSLIVVLETDKSSREKARFFPGASILALYPHTTTFYPGKIYSNVSEKEYGVQFDGDDLDENGIELVIKVIPMHFVISRK